MSDRHQAPYIPFRCSQETSVLISQIAKEQHRPKSEVLRDLVDKGLIASGAKVDDDYLYELVKRAVKEMMKPQVERLAAILAKSTQISSTAFFMSIYAATRSCSPSEQQEIEEAAGTARELGIQYLKLKNQDLDAFIKKGAKQIAEDE